MARFFVGALCGPGARELNERAVSPLVHAYLQGYFVGVYREYEAPVGRSATRVDFRFGDWPHGSNPCVMELAVRGTRTNQSCLSASTNRPELAKLSRFARDRASGGRLLLLLDFGVHALARDRVLQQYKAEHLGPGRFDRSNVSVLYVHRDSDYNFVWKPYANS